MTVNSKSENESFPTFKALMVSKSKEQNVQVAMAVTALDSWKKTLESEKKLIIEITYQKEVLDAQTNAELQSICTQKIEKNKNTSS
jgi:hypothetical protein